MEKTPNYQLSQWAKTDRILMEDFNADNARLEAALTALNTALGQKAAASALNSAKSALQTEDARLDSVKLEMVTILDQTYSVSNSTSLTIPVGSLASYAAVAVDLTLPSINTKISTGGSDSAVSTSGGAYLSNSLAQMAGTSRLLLFPMKQGSAYVTTTSYTQNAGTYLGQSSKTYASLRNLTLTFLSAQTASVKVTVTGIK